MASKEGISSGAPIQPAAKSTKAEPQVNSAMEMGSVSNGTTHGAQPEMDIMQIARIGDVAAMEKLFESEKYDATYCDDEGITALHVCPTTQASSIFLAWDRRPRLTLPCFSAVGCDQQPVCHVQVSDRKGCRDQ